MNESRLGLGLTLAALLFTAACTPNTEYPLVETSGQSSDPQLASGFDPKWDSLSFRHSDAHPSGILYLIACVKRGGLLRVVVDETHPRPIWIANKVDLVDPGCNQSGLFTGFILGDSERVRVQLGDSEATSYQDMRTYQISRTTEGLTAKFIGLETVDPEVIRPGHPTQVTRFNLPWSATN